jgi:hypothetical protein
MRNLVVILTLLIFILPAKAQLVKNGGLIYTLGKDTTLIGNYYLEKDVFMVHVVSLTPSLNVQQMRGKLFPNGEIEFAEGYNYKPVEGKEKEVLSSYRMYTKGDSSFIEVKRGDNVSKQQYKARTMISNSVGGQSIVFLLPLMINYAPSKTGDSLMSFHIVLNAARPFIIKRASPKQLIMGSTVMGFFKINLNEKGTLADVDAIGTSWNIKGSPVALLNMDSVVASNLAKEKATRVFGSISKLDSVQTTVSGVNLKIRYSRPSARGRVIFGEVVPWNRFWRTGANAATKLTIDKPIYFDGKELAAGEYSVWTMPSPSGWKIMFNKEANTWGTEYKPEHDVLVVPVQTTKLNAPVEVLTFDITEDGKGGIISVSWELTKASVRFSSVQ